VRLKDKIKGNYIGDKHTNMQVPYVITPKSDIIIWKHVLAGDEVNYDIGATVKCLSEDGNTLICQYDKKRYIFPRVVGLSDKSQNLFGVIK